MKKKKQSNLSVLMGYAKGHRFFTYAALVLSAISGVISLFPFIFIWRIIKEAIEVAPNFGNATDMVKNGWLAVAFSLAYIVVYFGALICSHVAAFRVQRNIQGKVLDHISTLPIGEIGEFGSGRLRSIVLESSAATETYLAHQLPDMVQAIMTPLAMVVMLFVFDWRLGLVSLLPVALGIAAIFPMAGPRMKDDVKNYQDAIGEMNNEAVEYVRGIPVVKTFNQSVFSFKRFSAAIAKYGKYCVDYTRVCRKYMIMTVTAINSVVCFLAAFALIDQILKCRATGFETGGIRIGDIVGDHIHIGLLRHHARSGSAQSFHRISLPYCTLLRRIKPSGPNGTGCSDANRCDWTPWPSLGHSCVGSGSSGPFR